MVCLIKGHFANWMLTFLSRLFTPQFFAKTVCFEIRHFLLFYFLFLIQIILLKLPDLLEISHLNVAFCKAFTFSSPIFHTEVELPFHFVCTYVRYYLQFLTSRHFQCHKSLKYFCWLSINLVLRSAKDKYQFFILSNDFLLQEGYASHFIKAQVLE